MGLFFQGLTVAQKVLIGATAVGTVASVAAERKATGAQEVELELAKRKEKSASLDREVARKNRLNVVLGAQRAAAGAQGASFSGSIANISLADSEAASLERLTDRAGTRLTIETLDRRKKSVRRVGTLRSGARVLSAATTIAQGLR